MVDKSVVNELVDNNATVDEIADNDIAVDGALVGQTTADEK